RSMINCQKALAAKTWRFVMRAHVGIALVPQLFLFACGRQTPSVVATDQHTVALAGDQPTACSGDRFPMTAGSSFPQCCQQGNQTWHENTVGATVHREYGAPCRMLDGSTDCSGSPKCDFGPCGARNIWVKGPGAIFYPKSDPTVCGWQ